MVLATKAGQGPAKVLAVTLSLFFVFFLSQVASHSHPNSASEVACHVCQVAHVGTAPQPGALAVEGPDVWTDYVQPFLLTLHEELFFHDSPSRAPPSL